MPTELLSRALADLLSTVGIEGAAVIGLSAQPAILCAAGLGSATIPAATAQLLRKRPVVTHGLASDRRAILVCPMDSGRALALWRMPGEAGWSVRDYPMMTAVSGLIRLIQEPRLPGGGFDPLTGLSYEAQFLSAVDRHISRLDAAGAIGTLMLVSPDRRAGAQGGVEPDDGLFQTTRMLSAILRPADRIGYIAADRLAAWLDHADHMTTAERAEIMVQRRVPEDDAVPFAMRRTLSIGIATRPQGSTDQAANLLARATNALEIVRREGGNGWRVALVEPAG